MAGLFASLAEIFSSPLGLTVLVLAFIGIMATIAWAFWSRQPSGHSNEVAQESLTPVAPPMLAPEMIRPAAMNNVPAGGESVLRNILIALALIIAGMLGMQALFATPKDVAQIKEEAVENEANPSQQASTEQSTPLPSSASLDCREGPVWVPVFEGLTTYQGEERQRIASYKVCAGPQAAWFDVIRFRSDDGMPLVEPVWKAKNVAALGTGSYDTEYYHKSEFVLSRDEFDMVAAPGTFVSEYDMFLAVGLAGFDVPDLVAEQRSANRGFHLARYVISEIRGDVPPTDCQSEAVVHALSLGQYQRGGSIAAAEDYTQAALAHLEDNEPIGQSVQQVAPVLLGIRYDPRTLLKDRNADALIADFLRSQGANIAGFDLRDFGPRQTLFVERACSGS